MLFIKSCGQDILCIVLCLEAEHQCVASICWAVNEFDESLAGHNAKAFNQENLADTATVEAMARPLDFWPHSRSHNIMASESRINSEGDSDWPILRNDSLARSDAIRRLHRH
tara:strand:- start:83 stop:418 length:336 start_codon:yes stop_codon:yes gene_type:complete